jgi:hypothetical protein
MSTSYSVNSMFPSRYLRPADLGNKELTLTIIDVTIEDLGTNDRKETKLVVHFKETDKLLVLNKTNATTISNLYGDQTSGWIGKRITLYVIEVSFQGTQMNGIRVRNRIPSQHVIQERDYPDLPEELPDFGEF